MAVIEYGQKGGDSLIEIRSMVAADFPEADAMLQELHLLHLTHRPDLYLPFEHVYAEPVYQAMLSDHAHICLMAEADSFPIGLCIASVRERTCMVSQRSIYLDDLYVKPAWRRQGAAAALLRRTEQRGRELGAARLDLMVWDFNTEALRFYERQGLLPQRHILEKPLEAD